MYSCSLSQASGMDSIPVCWKLDIFPRRAFVLPSGKNFVRNALEHLAQVLMSFSLSNHYFTFPRREKRNIRSLTTSVATPRMTMVSQSSRKFCKCAFASSFGLPQNRLACTMLMGLDLSSKFTSPMLMLGPMATLSVEGTENSQRVFSAIASGTSGAS